MRDTSCFLFNKNNKQTISRSTTFLFFFQSNIIHQYLCFAIQFLIGMIDMRVWCEITLNEILTAMFCSTVIPIKGKRNCAVPFPMLPFVKTACAFHLYAIFTANFARAKILLMQCRCTKVYQLYVEVGAREIVKRRGKKKSREKCLGRRCISYRCDCGEKLNLRRRLRHAIHRYRFPMNFIALHFSQLSRDIS